MNPAKTSRAEGVRKTPGKRWGHALLVVADLISTHLPNRCIKIAEDPDDTHR
jgi:hypothetical protein